MIRTLLIDDEQPARERLRQLLAAHHDVEVVGEAEDGLEAAEKIAQLTPDLVLLDIQMPGASGLDVAASLGKPRPAVIFCTAFDQYAVDAFELSATDYLLKPVNRARLAAALDRVRRQPRQGAARPRPRARGVVAGQRPCADALPRPPRRPLQGRPRPGRGRVHVRRRRDPPAHRDRATLDAAHARVAGAPARSARVRPGVAQRRSSGSTRSRKRSPSPTAPVRSSSPTA